MRTALLAICVALAACGSSQSAPSDDGGTDATTGQDSQLEDSIAGSDSSGPTCDGSCPADARPHDSAADSPSPPMCGTGGWLTYGHDGARTFASDACINGPLTRQWTYAPAAPTGRTLNAVQHALATSDGIYLDWAASDGAYIGTTAADRLSLAGARVWTFDSGSDANMGNWASLSEPVTVDGGLVQTLVVQDDGFYFLDLSTGKVRATTGVDWWGQSIPDPSGGVWFVDTSKSDGPGLFVGQIDRSAKTLWQQNKQGTMCGDSLTDQMGGIALDGGVLFYAALYVAGGTVQPTFKSGLYAFDAATGAPKWNVASTPASVISAGNGLVYGIEGGALVARSQKDGSSKWSKPLAGAGAQAPVLANSLVIVADAAGVSAFDATTGSPAWSTPVTGAAAAAYQGTITNGCSGSQNEGAAVATSLAAAVPSGTLVVTASDGIHVLSLATGQDKWHGAVPGATNAVHDPVLVGDMVYVVDSPPAVYSGFGPGQLIALKGS
jgi:outer membrane protein assembly factor BamB